MAKAAKETAFLVSSSGTGYFYCNRKNRKKFKGEKKLRLRRYDPILRKHVLFEEKKLSKLKKQNAGAKAPTGTKPSQSPETVSDGAS